MRIALEVVAVLERSRLALVDVDRHQPRRRLGAHDAPFAPRREARAAQAAQRRMLERRDDRVGRPLAADAGAQRPIAAARGGIRRRPM